MRAARTEGDTGPVSVPLPGPLAAPEGVPYFTIGLIAFMVVIYCLEAAFALHPPSWLEIDTDTLLGLGGTVHRLILDNNQLWRARHRHASARRRAAYPVQHVCARGRGGPTRDPDRLALVRGDLRAERVRRPASSRSSSTPRTLSVSERQAESSVCRPRPRRLDSIIRAVRPARASSAARSASSFRPSSRPSPGTPAAGAPTSRLMSAGPCSVSPPASRCSLSGHGPSGNRSSAKSPWPSPSRFSSSPWRAFRRSTSLTGRWRCWRPISRPTSRRRRRARFVLLPTYPRDPPGPLHAPPW